MKKQTLFGLSALVSMLLLSGCNTASTVEESNTAEAKTSDSVKESSSENTSIACEHRYLHYLSREATCANSGSKEYWECEECGEFTLVAPSSISIVDKGVATETFDSTDPRYIAKKDHKLHFHRQIPAKYQEDGQIAYYQCEDCHSLFDAQQNPIDESELTITRFSQAVPDLLDNICSDDESAKSLDPDVAASFANNFFHEPGSHTVTVANQSGWQLSKEKYTDISMRLKIDGVGRINPYGAGKYCTKGFLIGADAHGNKSNPSMPTGFMVNVARTDGGTQHWIQFYKWADGEQTGKGTFLGGVAADFEGRYFTLQVRGSSVSIFDETGKPMLMTPAENLGFHVTSIQLKGYQGGQIGVYSRTTQGQASPEPNTSTFHIENFSGTIMDNILSGEEFANELTNNATSYTSHDATIAELAGNWLAEGDTLRIQNGYNGEKGSFRLSNRIHRYFKMKARIDGVTAVDPYPSSAPSGSAILFGAKAKGNYFKGYSLTPYVSGNEAWIHVRYHNGSVKGSYVGGIKCNLEGQDFSFSVINKYLHIYDASGAEIIQSNSYWPGASHGLYLSEYAPGSIGFLKWDNKGTLFTCYQVEDVDNVSSEDYDLQDTSKRVNVFVLAGQSNMEGDTKYYIGNNHYLQNYCQDSGRDYNALEEGFEDVKLALHNNYMPEQDRENYTNPSDPLGAKFENTALGYGLTKNISDRSYFGPEVGVAEKLHNNGVGGKPTYLIKYASGGTSFNSTSCSWRSPSVEGGPGHLYQTMVQYVKNCISELESQGFVPVIKGLLWMQGESDSNTMAAADNYYLRQSRFIEDFRCEFASYARDNIGSNIAFIDAGIYMGEGTRWTYGGIVNQAKQDIAQLERNNYYIDTNATGLDCIVGTSRYNGGDIYHYTVDSMLKLGNGFGDVILNNNLLEF